MRLFISYARYDRRFVEELSSLLLPTHQVWYDQKIHIGQSWWEEILNKLEWCQGVILVISPHSIQSEFCRKEYLIARKAQKVLLPVRIHVGVEIPGPFEGLESVEIEEFPDGIEVIPIVNLLNAITRHERVLNSRPQRGTIENLAFQDAKPPQIVTSEDSPYQKLLPLGSSLTLDLAFARKSGGRVGDNTERTYLRWIGQYLVDVGRFERLGEGAGIERLNDIGIDDLYTCLTPAQFQVWLTGLAGEGYGGSALQQAHAAIVTLVELLEENGVIDRRLATDMKVVEVPRSDEDGETTTARHLSDEELGRLIQASREVATSESQAWRNYVVTAMLCLMALSRGELVGIQWGDILYTEGGMLLQRIERGGELTTIKIPKFMQQVIEHWKQVIVQGSAPPPRDDSHVVRRVWKGGRIGDEGLTPDGVWYIITEAARFAELGHVSPSDVRRSAVGVMYQSGVPLERINHLLGHASLEATVAYIARLPKKSTQATKMSDMLDLTFKD